VKIASNLPVDVAGIGEAVFPVLAGLR